MPRRIVVGCMSGTSIDALDAALVVIEGTGLEIRAEVVRGATRPLGELAALLRRLASSEPMSADRIAGLSHELTRLHIAAIREVLGNDRPDLIAVHGQTVFHAPPISWQLLTPAPIADAFAAPVVFDLRAADLAAGGQGAPITPLADYVLFREADESRAVVNLGGFANYTILPPSADPASPSRPDAPAAIRAGDICACNQILDAIAREVFGVPFDQDGQRAAAGQVCAELADGLAELLRNQARAGRSLGTGDELGDWVVRHRAGCRGEDLARSACAALAVVIGETIERVATEHGVEPPLRILLGGGSVRNCTLLAALEEHCPATVTATDACGVPAGYREAAAMAVLGALCQDRIPITLPQVTGVRQPAPLSGSWVYPR